jgi:hypothetical protein
MIRIAITAGAFEAIATTAGRAAMIQKGPV